MNLLFEQLWVKGGKGGKAEHSLVLRRRIFPDVRLILGQVRLTGMRHSPHLHKDFLYPLEKAGGQIGMRRSLYAAKYTIGTGCEQETKQKRPWRDTRKGRYVRTQAPVLPTAETIAKRRDAARMDHAEGNVLRTRDLHCLALRLVRYFIREHNHCVGIPDLIRKIPLVPTDTAQLPALFLCRSNVFRTQAVHSTNQCCTHSTPLIVQVF